MPTKSLGTQIIAKLTVYENSLYQYGRTMKNCVFKVILETRENQP